MYRCNNACSSLPPSLLPFSSFPSSFFPVPFPFLVPSSFFFHLQVQAYTLLSSTIDFHPFSTRFCEIWKLRRIQWRNGEDRGDYSRGWATGPSQGQPGISGKTGRVGIFNQEAAPQGLHRASLDQWWNGEARGDDSSGSLDSVAKRGGSGWLFKWLSHKAFAGPAWNQWQDRGNLNLRPDFLEIHTFIH